METDPVAILVCGPSEAAMIAPILQGLGAGVDVLHAPTLAALRDALAAAPGPARLVTFCTDIIIPRIILNALPMPGINIHPGPPEYPGLFPGVHALYGGAQSFGATAHLLAPRVDTGPIIAVERFDIPHEADRAALDALTWQAVVRLINTVGPALLDPRIPLPESGELWSGPALKRRDFEALCQLPEDCTQTEFDRRYRAVGEGPDHALSITLFGHRFALDNQRDPSSVTVAGHAKP